jgi:Heme/copper-type cytochrome/quinol oxidases, subunit 1
VVGIQYLLGIGAFAFIGGLNAMLIRYELLTPTQHAWNANNYLTLVGLHGTMMMGVMTSAVLGPFANYFVPIMIGARRMAFPRIEALTFWLLMAAGFILMTSLAFGGFPTGGRATSRSPTRRTWAWTRTSRSSRSSACR